MEDEKFVTYFMSAIPWKDCPFKLYMAVATKNGPEDAQKTFKKFYQNDSMEISDCFEIPVVRADLLDEIMKEAVRKSKSMDN